MDESEYERKRRENMRQNAAALAALGLDDESTRLQERKRPRAEPRERKERAIQPKQKTSLRAAGVGADASAEEVEAAVAAAAAAAGGAVERATREGVAVAPVAGPSGGTPRPRATGAQLSDEQRAAQRAHLADASGWLAQMSEHFHGRLSDFNHAKVMRHAEELASGAGIQLPGLGERVFEGRPIHISDDLVALREEARAFARWDVGGWRLNHPIGKLIAFQQELYADVDGDPATAGGEAGAPAWLRVGAAVEVAMDEAELRGSRFTATVIAVDAERAEVEYDELFEDEAGTAKLREWQRFAVVRPPPPVLSGFMHKLRPGTMCELWHDGGWWEVAVIDRKKGSGGGLALEVESPLYNEVKQEKAGSEVLRPRWALVPRRKGEAEAKADGDASVDWLAMAPFGFKLPWGTTAHELGPADLPIGALSAERAAALEARAAAKAEKAAAAAAAAEAKAAAKEEKAAARAAAQAEAEAAKAERAAAALPWRCVLAMRAGKKSRDDIVAFLQADGQPTADRGHIVTVLGKEPKMAEPRWTQSGEAYKLTKHGKSYTPFADGVEPPAPKAAPKKWAPPAHLKPVPASPAAKKASAAKKPAAKKAPAKELGGAKKRPRPAAGAMKA